MTNPHTIDKASAEGLGVRVKPLEWVERERSDCTSYWHARTSIGIWQISRPDDHMFADQTATDRFIITRPILPPTGIHGTRHKTLDEAKAGAQADFEQRILSALLSTNTPRNE